MSVDVAVKVGTVRVRSAREPQRLRQLGVRIPADLVRKLRLYAIERDLLVQDVVEGCVRSIVEGAGGR